MPGPISTVEGSGFIPEVWLARALGRLRPYITVQRTVTMDTDVQPGEAFTVGRTLHLPRRGTLVANDKTEQGDFTMQNPQSSTVDLTLAYHKEVSFQLTSEMIAFQNQDQSIGYLEDGLIVLAEAIDTVLFSAYLQVPASQIVGTGLAITEANVIAARKILRDNRINPNAQMFGVVTTAQEANLLQLTNTVRYDALGVGLGVADARVGNGIVVMPGAIGKLYGFEICPSQLAPVSAGASNASQTLTIAAGPPTSGTFTLTANALTTGPIPWNATPSQVQAALAQILGAGTVFVSGTQLPAGSMVIAQTGSTTFPITAASALLPSGTATIAQTGIVAGGKNLFYTSDFILMATRALPLPQPGTGALGTVMTDPDTGMTFRLVKSWNATKGYEQITLDILFGYTLMRPEHGVVVATT